MSRTFLIFQKWDLKYQLNESETYFSEWIDVQVECVVRAPFYFCRGKTYLIEYHEEQSLYCTENFDKNKLCVLWTFNLKKYEWLPYLNFPISSNL